MREMKKITRSRVSRESKQAIEANEKMEEFMGLDDDELSPPKAPAAPLNLTAALNAFVRKGLVDVAAPAPEYTPSKEV